MVSSSRIQRARAKVKDVVRVIICDDHPLTRNGLKAALEAAQSQHELRVVGEASNGLEAVAMCGRLEPDIILLDLSMPEMSGLEAITRIRKTSPDSKIVVCTQHEDQSHLSRAVTEGAHGYISKRAGQDEISLAIRQVLAGHTYVQPNLAHKSVLISSTLGAPLNPEETEVLRRHARGQSFPQMEKETHMSLRTTKRRSKSLCEKLGASTPIEAVSKAAAQGLV